MELTTCRFESADFTCEWKYDGERAQIHVLEGGETRVYSRNSENNTSKYPDIIARMPNVSIITSGDFSRIFWTITIFAMWMNSELRVPFTSSVLMVQYSGTPHKRPPLRGHFAES